MDFGAAASYKERVRVLVVEDKKKIASFLRKGLEERGFVVDVCHRGDEGGERIAFVTRKDVIPEERRIIALGTARFGDISGE